MPFVAAGSSDVHYVEHGATAADATRTLVVLHGFTADHRMMVAAIEPLLGHRAGWRRLYLDLPGMGRTAAAPGLASTDDVFAVVAAAIDALVTGPFAVAGLSYGGHLALGLIVTRPELITGVALFVPVVIAGHVARDVPAPRVLFEEPGLVYPPDGSLAEHGVVRTAETLRRIRDEIEVGRPRRRHGRARSHHRPLRRLVPAGHGVRRSDARRHRAPGPRGRLPRPVEPASRGGRVPRSRCSTAPATTSTSSSRRCSAHSSPTGSTVWRGRSRPFRDRRDPRPLAGLEVRRVDECAGEGRVVARQAVHLGGLGRRPLGQVNGDAEASRRLESEPRVVLRASLEHHERLAGGARTPPAPRARASNRSPAVGPRGTTASGASKATGRSPAGPSSVTWLTITCPTIVPSCSATSEPPGSRLPDSLIAATRSASTVEPNAVATTRVIAATSTASSLSGRTLTSSPRDRASTGVSMACLAVEAFATFRSSV